MGDLVQRPTGLIPGTFVLDCNVIRDDTLTICMLTVKCENMYAVYMSLGHSYNAEKLYTHVGHMLSKLRHRCTTGKDPQTEQ